MNEKKKKKKVNKYLYGWRFSVDYGYGDGFEYECFEDTYAGMIENRKAYRQNLPPGARLRIGQGRELNPEWERLHGEAA